MVLPGRDTVAGAHGCSRRRWPIMAPTIAPTTAPRSSCAYGGFLRRHQPRVDARGQLRRALERFEDLHCRPLAERAGQELSASSETARKRHASTALSLTPMERKGRRSSTRACRTKTSPGSAGCLRAPWISICATSSPKPMSPREARSPTWTFPDRTSAAEVRPVVGQDATRFDDSRPAIGCLLVELRQRPCRGRTARSSRKLPDCLLRNPRIVAGVGWLHCRRAPGTERDSRL